MNPEHVFIIIRGARMRVRDSPLRIIEREPVAMDSAREVDILGVHANSLFRCRGAIFWKYTSF